MDDEEDGTSESASEALYCKVSGRYNTRSSGMAMIAAPDNIGTQGFQFIKAALRIGAHTWVAIEAA